MRTRADIHEYETGRFLRIASLEEEITYCENLAQMHSGERAIGAVSGEPYGFDGTVYMLLSDESISDLKTEAEAVGDKEQVALCDRAIWEENFEARAECLQVILSGQEKDFRAESVRDALSESYPEITWQILHGDSTTRIQMVREGRQIGELNPHAESAIEQGRILARAQLRGAG